MFSVQTVQRITLNTMTLSIYTERVYTSAGVPISVIGTAQVILLPMFFPKIGVPTLTSVQYIAIGAAKMGNFSPHDPLDCWTR